MISFCQGRYDNIIHTSLRSTKGMPQYVFYYMLNHVATGNYKIYIDMKSSYLEPYI